MDDLPGRMMPLSGSELGDEALHASLLPLQEEIVSSVLNPTGQGLGGGILARARDGVNAHKQVNLGLIDAQCGIKQVIEKVACQIIERSVCQNYQMYQIAEIASIPWLDCCSCKIVY